MEVTGLTFAIMAEVRAVGKGIIERIVLVKEAPSRFCSVCRCVTRLLVTIDGIEDVGKRKHALFPEELVEMFRVNFAVVRDTLFDVQEKLDKHGTKTASGVYSIF